MPAQSASCACAVVSFNSFSDSRDVGNLLTAEVLTKSAIATNKHRQTTNNRRPTTNQQRENPTTTRTTAINARTNNQQQRKKPTNNDNIQQRQQPATTNKKSNEGRRASTHVTPIGNRSRVLLIGRLCRINTSSLHRNGYLGG